MLIVHPVTWEAPCEPVPHCRHEQQLQGTLSCLSCARAGSSPVPRRVRLASPHSWERELLLLASKQRPGRPLPLAAAPALVWCASPPDGLSWGPYPKLVIPGIWGSGLVSSIKLRLGRGVVLLSPARMLRLLGDLWARCPDGSVLTAFHPLSGAHTAALGTSKKGSVSREEPGRRSSPHCRILQ